MIHYFDAWVLAKEVLTHKIKTGMPVNEGIDHFLMKKEIDDYVRKKQIEQFVDEEDEN